MQGEIIYTCVLRSGGDFSPADVENLRNGIERHAPGVNKRITCLTDLPSHKLPARVKRKKLPKDWPGWWSKICLFYPGMFPVGSRVVYFDLDCILMGDVSPLVEYEDQVVAGRPWKVQAGELHYGLSSWCMCWSAGALNHIYEEFKESDMAWRDKIPVPARGDQGWIYKCLKENWIAVQDILPGVYSYKRHCSEGIPEDARMLVFHGKPRPRDAAKHQDDVKRLLSTV